MFGNGIALVTGAAGGLGRATAVMLANRGMKVVLADTVFEKYSSVREMIPLMREPKNTLFQPINIIESESVNKVLDAAEERFGGPPTLVVHCAGVTASHSLFDEHGVHSLNLFDRVLNINTSGTFNVARLAAQRIRTIKPWKGGERGLIITTSSMTGYEGGAKQIAYSTSKAAVIGMTLPFARALGEYGIRFNSISPGMFLTPMLEGYEEAVEALEELIPFPKRLGTAKDFTKAVEFLMDCSMVNGAVIRVDGGLRA